MAAPSTGDDYRKCSEDEKYRTRCAVHGGILALATGRCQTYHVLDDVRAERTRQYAQYGNNEDLLDGTGPDVEWLGLLGDGLDAVELQKTIRSMYEINEATHGKPTFRHLVLEEVAEAFLESAPRRLRDELVQVAGLCVSWIEKIDARIPAWEDIHAFDVQPGDLAFHVDGHDPREVSRLDPPGMLWLNLLNSEGGPYPIDQYTFRRRMS